MRCSVRFMLVIAGILLLPLPLYADGVTVLLQEQCAGCHSLAGPAAQTLADFKARKGPDLFYAGTLLSG